MALKRIENLDSRYIWAIIFISISLVTLHPLGLPLVISSRSKNIYSIISSLPDGAKILVAQEIGVADFALPQTYPCELAVLKHLLTKKCVFVFMSGGTVDDSGLMIDAMVERGDFPIDKQGVYGTAWINVGWIPGGETSLNAWGADPWGVKPYDFQGIPVSTSPLAAKIKTVKDFDLWIIASRGIADSNSYLRQLAQPYKIAPLFIIAPEQLNTYLPFVQSGQGLEVMYGARLAAEYESLIRSPGLGAITTEPIGILVIIMIALLAIGQIPVIARRSWKKDATKTKE